MVESQNLAMSSTQPRYGPAHTRFHEWLDDVRKKSRGLEIVDDETTETTGFIPRSEIKAEMKKERINSLLKEEFDRGQFIWPNDIEGKCLHGYCILLSIHQGRAIEQLTRNAALWDNRLPLSSQPPGFPLDVWQSFEKAQWEFVQLDLDRGGMLSYREEYILPIIKKKLIGQGGSSKVWQITVHKEYDKLSGRPRDPNLPHGEYAMKEYVTNRAEDYYKRETSNFRRLCNANKDGIPGLVDYLGAFKHGNSHYLLMEFAEHGSLLDYLENEKPPRDALGTLTFWRKMMDVLGALARIHDLEDPPDGQGIAQRYQGTHQDIRPSNIVITSNPSTPSIPFDFKLADLGLGRFVMATAEDREMTMDDNNGGRTYGSPEACRNTYFERGSRLPVTTKTDVFSLGCIFLVVAIWLVYGKEEVKVFEEQRKKENDESNSFAEYRFHNGSGDNPALLKAVTSRLSGIRGDLRNYDCCTGRIVEHIIDLMLEPLAKDRSTAQTMRKRFEVQLGNAEKELDRSRANSIGPNYYGQPLQQPAGRRGDGSRYSARSQPLLSSNQSQTPQGQNVSGFGPFTKSPRNTILEDSPFPHPSHLNSEGIQGNSEHDDRNLDDLRFSEPLPIFGDESAPSESLITRKGRESFTLDGYPRQKSKMPLRDTSIMSEGLLGPVTNGQPPEVHDQSSRQPGRSAAASAVSSPIQSHSPHQSVGGLQSPTAEPITLPIFAAGSGRPVEPATVSRILEWKRLRKQKFGKWRTHLPDIEIGKSFIKNRDHIFLIDDSISMEPYWGYVVHTFAALSYLVKDCDPDGIEVMFTRSKMHEKSIDTKGLVRLVEEKTSRAGQTDISIRLGEILRDRRDLILSRKGRSSQIQGGPPATICVLTNGAWEGGADAETSILATMKFLKENNFNRKMIGISFISFGDDEVGLQRMRELDELGKHHDSKIDNVDTEPFLGDVWKMLIGPIDEIYDKF